MDTNMEIYIVVSKNQPEDKAFVGIHKNIQNAQFHLNKRKQINKREDLYIKKMLLSEIEENV